MLIKLDNIDYYAYTANHAPVVGQDTVVFVHGAAMDHSVWAHQSRYFAYHGYNVAAVDLPGHNLSGGELLGDIPAMGRWLADIIDAIIGVECDAELDAEHDAEHDNTPAVHLVGHSMGALIALEAAAGVSRSSDVSQPPDANPSSGANPSSALPRSAQSNPLKSLTLVGFSYPMAVTPQLLAAARDDPSAACAMMTQWSHASKIGGEPVPGFWSPGMQMSMLENSAPGAILADLSACNQYTGGERAFAATHCPTLFICGRLDKMAPAKLAQAHADQNDHAEIVFIPDCGHSLLSESPDGVLQELKRFIGQHRPISNQP